MTSKHVIQNYTQAVSCRVNTSSGSKELKPGLRLHYHFRYIPYMNKVTVTAKLFGLRLRHRKAVWVSNFAAEGVDLHGLKVKWCPEEPKNVDKQWQSGRRHK